MTHPDSSFADEFLRQKRLIDDDGNPLPSALIRHVTALLPAAGRGSRLGYQGPKALYPLGDKPLLQILMEKLEPITDETVVVINPEHTGLFKSFSDNTGFKPSYAFQEQPTGMGDAILIGAEKAGSAGANRDILIIWGDQVTANPRTLLQSLLYHQHCGSGMDLTFPTCRLENPYIHFETSVDGKVTSLAQRREGDEMPRIGNNDCGVFIARLEILINELKQFREVAAPGTETREFNFLPFVVWLAEKGYKVAALPLAVPLETIGVNTEEDARNIARELGIDFGKPTD